MRTLIESLKRLYEQDKVSYQKLVAMRDTGTITVDEYGYIKSEKGG